MAFENCTSALLAVYDCDYFEYSGAKFSYRVNDFHYRFSLCRNVVNDNDLIVSFESSAYKASKAVRLLFLTHPETSQSLLQPMSL